MKNIYLLSLLPLCFSYLTSCQSDQELQVLKKQLKDRELSIEVSQEFLEEEHRAIARERAGLQSQRTADEIEMMNARSEIKGLLIKANSSAAEAEQSAAQALRERQQVSAKLKTLKSLEEDYKNKIGALELQHAQLTAQEYQVQELMAQIKEEQRIAEAKKARALEAKQAQEQIVIAIDKMNNQLRRLRRDLDEGERANKRLNNKIEELENEEHILSTNYQQINYNYNYNRNNSRETYSKTPYIKKPYSKSPYPKTYLHNKSQISK